MKKILLADDSITIQKVVELTFSEGDYQVICVSNGAQALRKIPEVRPDVVLLDVIMPEKNGYEVCEEIKRSPSTSWIPVLLLTGTFEPFDKKRAEAAGAQGHLTKPFESQALVSKVEELIASRPTVVSREEAGAMDVISGGDVYHVEPGRPEEGLRPTAPPIPAGLVAPPRSSGSPGLESRPEPASPPPAMEAAEEGPEPEWSHPRATPPDPAAGGAYIGFADLEIGSEESTIVPDRFDEAVRNTPPGTAPSSATPPTAHIDRSELFRGDILDAPGATPSAREPARPAEPIEGLTGAFESQGSQGGAVAAGVSSPVEDWTPPAEAPPAETWQTLDEAAAPPPAPGWPAAEPSSSRAAPTPGSSAPGSGNGPPALTPEAIDLIAERVVARLSDRVVREIAWEVIPQVAETLVRRRIKELEDGEGD